MGGFASSAVTVGRSLLGPALTVYGAYSDAKSRSAPARVAFDDGGVLAAAQSDARAAERRLAAQTAQIGVATGDLYPMFSLNGSFEWQAS